MLKSVTLRYLIKHLENTIVNSQASIDTHCEFSSTGGHKVLLVPVVAGSQAWPASVAIRLLESGF